MTQYGPQEYGQQLPPHHGHPYGPPQPHRAPARSRGLAITALVISILAIVVGLTPLLTVGIPIGLIGAILATIALIAKTQGGKKFAGAALGLGLAAMGLSLLMYGLAINQPKQHKTQQEITDCMSKPGLSADEIWACTN
ncbi:hypothetical protein AB0L53_54725 [Nonomuraea sp. NPDC052129]|uniref:hypothetical protein n=1 Tax=Nonomuraea sp. NPDC052129 TaxID=3154651 RepID=UPI0034296AE1